MWRAEELKQTNYYYVIYVFEFLIMVPGVSLYIACDTLIFGMFVETLIHVDALRSLIKRFPTKNLLRKYEESYSKHMTKCVYYHCKLIT